MTKVRSTKVSTNYRTRSYWAKSVVLPANVLAATLVMTPLFMLINNQAVGASGNQSLEGQPNSQTKIDFSAPNLKPAAAPTSYKTNVHHTAGHVVSINTHAIDLTALPDAAFGDHDE